MNRLYNKILPILIALLTIVPIYAVLLVLSLKDFSISNSTLSYLSKSFFLSLGLTFISFLMCWFILVILLAKVRQINPRILNLFSLLLILTLFIGTIPKIMGYLGAFSNSGLLGILFKDTGLTYSFLGSSLALFYVYSPFFFLPILTSINNDSNYQKSIQLFNASSWDTFNLNLKIHRNTIGFSSFLFFSLVFMDYTCTDLVGGGKYDAYGKALYRSAITFKEPLIAFFIGSLVLSILLVLFKIFRK